MTEFEHNEDDSEVSGPNKELADLVVPEPGEIPTSESLRDMLEQHAYGAGKIFAQRGTKPYSDQVDWVNYGTANGIQLMVDFQEQDTPGQNEDLDKHVVRVLWRPKHESLSESEGWGERYGQEAKADFNVSILYDHTRPGIGGVAGEEKRMHSRRDQTSEDGGWKIRLEESNPEEVAYIDSLLTDLVSQRPGD